MQTEEIPDLELLARVREGETACYGALVSQHHRRLYRAAFKIVRNGADAEDAVQEAYLRSFRRLDQFEGRSPPIAGGGRSPVEFLAAPARDPEQQASRQWESRLGAALAAQPEEYQGVFRLREMEGMNTEDAARRLGISEGRLKTRLFRAKRLLRKQIGWLQESAVARSRASGGAI